jgi:hypothetical protein
LVLFFFIKNWGIENCFIMCWCLEVKGCKKLSYSYKRVLQVQFGLMMDCGHVLSRTLSMMWEKVKKMRSTAILFRMVVILKILQHWKWNSFVPLLVFYVVTSIFIHGADYMLKNKLWLQYSRTNMMHVFVLR